MGAKRTFKARNGAIKSDISRLLDELASAMARADEPEVLENDDPCPAPLAYRISAFCLATGLGRSHVYNGDSCRAPEGAKVRACDDHHAS